MTLWYIWIKPVSSLNSRIVLVTYFWTCKQINSYSPFNMYVNVLLCFSLISSQCWQPVSGVQWLYRQFGPSRPSNHMVTSQNDPLLSLQLKCQTSVIVPVNSYQISWMSFSIYPHWKTDSRLLVKSDQQNLCNAYRC